MRKAHFNLPSACAAGIRHSEVCRSVARGPALLLQRRLPSSPPPYLVAEATPWSCLDPPESERFLDEVLV
ncbi:unnamed protein product [Arctogadus glacialis]